MAASQTFLQGLRTWVGKKCGFPVNLGSECLCDHSWAVRLTLGRFMLLGVEGPASHQGPSRKRVLTEHTCLLLVHIIFLPETGTSKQTEINPNLPHHPCIACSPLTSGPGGCIYKGKEYTPTDNFPVHPSLPRAFCVCSQLP